MLIRRTPTVFERFFDDMNRVASNDETHIALALDVYENEDGYVVTADVPGIAVDDIDIRLDDNVLTISAETSYEHQDENWTALLQERHHGKFSRSLRFPVNVNNDAVEADYNNGVLTIKVPKAEEVKPRRIAVKTAN